MPRIPALAAFVVLLAWVASGCALLDDVGDSDLDDALELVPEGADQVTFTHRRAVAERLGIDDVETGAGREEIDGYVEILLDDASAGATQFASFIVPMSEGAAFSELDIVWEATASAETGISEALPRAYKMRDDLDLDAVADDLVAVGYEEDEIAGHRHLFIDPVTDPEADGMIGAYPGVQMSQVVVVPDEHLMLVGGTPDTVATAVDVLEDDADSATDAGTFDDVLDGVDDPEYAQLSGSPACAAEVSEVGAPEATGFFVSGDDARTSSVLAFPDDDAAETGLEQREAYLAEGLMLATGEPIADIADWTIERDGNVLRIDYEYDDPGIARDAAGQSDGFHACAPD